MESGVLYHELAEYGYGFLFVVAFGYEPDAAPRRDTERKQPEQALRAGFFTIFFDPDLRVEIRSLLNEFGGGFGF